MSIFQGIYRTVRITVEISYFMNLHYGLQYLSQI